MSARLQIPFFSCFRCTDFVASRILHHQFRSNAIFPPKNGVCSPSFLSIPIQHHIALSRFCSTHFSCYSELTSRRFLSTAMVTQEPPKLKVLLRDGYVDIEDAVNQELSSVLETLINAFLLLPLDPHTLTRLQLGDYFRRSLQSSRQTTPYRLHTIVTECKAGLVDQDSLEAKFFEHGGVRTVTAFAAAAADNKKVVSMINDLSDTEFQAFLRSIDAIEPHRDLLFIIETLERKRPSRLSKRKHVPGPRPPRSSRTRGHYSQTPGSVPQALERFQMVNSSPINTSPAISHSHRPSSTLAHTRSSPTFLNAQGEGRSITADLGNPAETVPASGMNTIAAVALQHDDGPKNPLLRASEHTFPQGELSCPLSFDGCLSFISSRQQPSPQSIIRHGWQMAV